MAALELRNQIFRVVFMHAGKKYGYSLDDEPVRFSAFAERYLSARVASVACSVRAVTAVRCAARTAASPHPGAGSERGSWASVG